LHLIQRAWCLLNHEWSQRSFISSTRRFFFKFLWIQFELEILDNFHRRWGWHKSANWMGGETRSDGFEHAHDVEREFTWGPSFIIQTHQITTSPSPWNSNWKINACEPMDSSFIQSWEFVGLKKFGPVKPMWCQSFWEKLQSWTQWRKISS
jgi:hypothetical protein